MKNPILGINFKPCNLSRVCWFHCSKTINLLFTSAEAGVTNSEYGHFLRSSHGRMTTYPCAYQGVKNVSFSEHFADVINEWPLMLCYFNFTRQIRKVLRFNFIMELEKPILNLFGSNTPEQDFFQKTTVLPLFKLDETITSCKNN